MVKWVLPIALRVREQGKVGILVARENAAEAAVVPGLQVIRVHKLREAVGFLQGEVKIASTKLDMTRIFEQDHEDEVDFAEAKGQESVKGALEIAIRSFAEREFDNPVLNKCLLEQRFFFMFAWLGLGNYVVANEELAHFTPRRLSRLVVSEEAGDPPLHCPARPVFPVLPFGEGALVHAQEFPAVHCLHFQVEPPVQYMLANVGRVGRISAWWFHK